MYLTFYHLKTKPFRITCDPRFLWLGESHREALATLRYGILDNRGFLLLTGEVGTGKTLLINRLVTMLPTDTVVTTLPDPDLTRMDFYKLLADGFKLLAPSKSKADFIIQLRDFLHLNADYQRQVLLIIDEAQRLNHYLMEDIRVLSNIEFSDRKLINIFFVGQPEFNQILMREQNRALTQRITIRYHINPLNLDEIHDYIGHRLKVAGCRQKLFKAGAEKKIHLYTGGIPRLINILCDHALVTGYIRNRRKIGGDIIVECAQELGIADWRKISLPERQSFISARNKAAIRSSQRSTGARKAYAAAPRTTGSPAHSRIRTVSGRMAQAMMLTAIFVTWLFVFYQLPGQARLPQPQWTLMRSQRTSDLGIIHSLQIPHLMRPTAGEIRTAPPEERRVKDVAVVKIAPIENREDQRADVTASVAIQGPPSGKPEVGNPGVPMKLAAPLLGKKVVKNTIIKPPKVKDASRPENLSAHRPRPVNQTTALVGSGGSAIARPVMESIAIQFDQADQIAIPSMLAIDRVASYLIEHPEKMIYLRSPLVAVDASANPLDRRNQRIDAVRSYLVGKGAYKYQVKVLPPTTVGRLSRSTRGPSFGGVMIEFPQTPAPVAYNPDK